MPYPVDLFNNVLQADSSKDSAWVWVLLTLNVLKNDCCVILVELQVLQGLGSCRQAISTREWGKD